ncbi:hypothetical protein F3Y22_tig00110234pilonHSYRG00019 [Hibiscus syriacus]|uniref:Homeobox domain-containing protein n=1 Tax=Hibiscus syriacus TaxID=106335 RepID=A0A6A3B8Q2_HIBSY|nr:hypothetical protein F3Y22_tig00110234pilonHSYRG00019 [Hibiscus syriacus]
MSSVMDLANSNPNLVQVGYASGLAGRENNQNPKFIGEVLSNNARENNVCAAMQYSGIDICGQDSKRHCGELQFVSSSLYDVTAASSWTNRPQLEHCSSIQGLSLTLSSNPSSEICGAGQFTEDQCGSHAFMEAHQDSKALKPGHLICNYSQNSRFLKPAQELLDQYCRVTNSKLGKVYETSDGVSNGICVSASVAVADAVDTEDGAIKGNNSWGSASGLCTSNEISSVNVGVGCSSCRPEYQQKKTKLLYLQDEAIQAILSADAMVSSFESVACLSAATPYISLALKTVERNFRNLVGLTWASLNPNNKAGGSRGLPERAVAILRAWLFEHFLHPYPTDTDKHMLAIRTGLSRNQVSNWFINARVRVWKPMVEEIHMLEKGLEAINQNSSRTDAKSTTSITIRPNEDQSISSSCIYTTSDKQLTCSDMAVECRYHEKHLSMDFGISSSMDGSLISFTPHEQSRLEMRGLGAVSLTLGLEHGVESAEVFQQHQQQYQPHEYQLQGQFRGQVIHDFATCTDSRLNGRDGIYTDTFTCSKQAEQSR